MRGDASLPDPDEAAALEKAAEAIGGAKTAKDAAYACISAWIQERARRSSSARLSDNLVFDLGDAQMRGFVESALGQIAGAVAHLDLSRPVLEMPKDDIITLFVAAIAASSESAVAAGESSAFPFSDEVPF